jgi:hypothetical protein
LWIIDFEGVVFGQEDSEVVARKYLRQEVVNVDGLKLAGCVGADG